MLTAPDFKEKQIVLVFLSRGEKLSFKNDNIIVSDEEGKIKHQSTCYRLFALFVVGHITITTGLLQRSKKFAFSIILMSHSLRVYGVWGAETEGNTLLRKKQYGYSALDIAKKIVHNKINGQIYNLSKIRDKGNGLKEAILSLKDYQKQISTVQDLQGLLGVEGISSRVYFKKMFEPCEWKSRRPRAKHDIVNLLLDIGYTLLFNYIEALLKLYGFDIYQGAYHQLFYQRKSLVCDLVEPFRFLIDDRIRKSWNLGQIKNEDFLFRRKQYFLFGDKAKPYMAFLLKVIIENKQEIFLYVQQYYRAFIKNKNIELYPYFKKEEKIC